MQELTKQLSQKLNKELDDFIEYIKSKQTEEPNIAINKAYEICWKREIVFVLEELPEDYFETELIQEALTIKGLLDLLYSEWLARDCSEVNESILDCFRSTFR